MWPYIAGEKLDEQHFLDGRRYFLTRIEIYISKLKVENVAPYALDESHSNAFSRAWKNILHRSRNRSTYDRCEATCDRCDSICSI